MRCILPFLLALPLAGCACPGSPTSTGWHWGFDIGRPSTALSPILVTQGGPSAGPIAALSLGAVAGAPARSVMALAADDCGPQPPVAARGSVFAARAPGCTLDDVCQKLDALNNRLSAKEPLPMPKPLP